MRRHGQHATEKALNISVFVDYEIAQAMWSMRVHREARSGATIVAGPRGEVHTVLGLDKSGYGVRTIERGYKISHAVLARLGQKWTEAQLREVLAEPRQ